MSDSVGPHRQQPTRLPRPWDSPGKNTGVGCHFLLQCRQVKSESESLSRVRLLATPWTAAYQAPASMGFSRQGYWSGVPLPSPRNNPNIHQLMEDKQNMAYLHNGFSATKGNEMLVYTTMWMNFENTVSERKRKATYCMILFI